MNKYELALVVSAKIEDDARTAVVEKARYHIIRGTLDTAGVAKRKQARSKYGAKRRKRNNSKKVS